MGNRDGHLRFSIFFIIFHIILLGPFARHLYVPQRRRVTKTNPIQPFTQNFNFCCFCCCLLGLLFYTHKKIRSLCKLCRRGLAAARDLRKGEPVLRVPRSALLTSDSVMRDEKFASCVKRHPHLSSTQVGFSPFWSLLFFFFLICSIAHVAELSQIFIISVGNLVFYGNQCHCTGKSLLFLWVIAANWEIVYNFFIISVGNIVCYSIWNPQSHNARTWFLSYGIKNDLDILLRLLGQVLTSYILLSLYILKRQFYVKLGWDEHLQRIMWIWNELNSYR